MAGVRGGAVLPSPFEQNSLAPSMAVPHGAVLGPHGMGTANVAPGHGQGPPPPLAIRVSRELLTPWEVQLAQQVNAMAAPIHIEMLDPEQGALPPPPAHYKLPELASDPVRRKGWDRGGWGLVGPPRLCRCVWSLEQAWGSAQTTAARGLARFVDPAVRQWFDWRIAPLRDALSSPPLPTKPCKPTLHPLQHPLLLSSSSPRARPGASWWRAAAWSPPRRTPAAWPTSSPG